MLETNGTKLIIIGCIISLILFLLIYLINTLAKNGKKILVDINKKSSNTNDKPSLESIRDKIYKHKFFIIIKEIYVDGDYQFNFSTYDILINHGIKKENQDLIDFKKNIANVFLTKCLFKYLSDSIDEWINEVIDDFKTNCNEDYDKIPLSTCKILEKIIRFTVETSKLASNVQIQFKSKPIKGIPIDFTKMFCEIVNSSLSSVRDTLCDIIYGTNGTWYDKIIEVLDVFELIMVYIKDSVDSTLAALNGQMEKYIERLNSSEK